MSSGRVRKSSLLTSRQSKTCAETQRVFRLTQKRAAFLRAVGHNDHHHQPTAATTTDYEHRHRRLFIIIRSEEALEAAALDGLTP